MMLRVWVCTGVLIALCCTSVLPGKPIPSWAQGLERGVALTLRDAVDLALRQIERGSLQVAHWRIIEESGSLWPGVSVRGRYARDSSSIVQQAGSSVVSSGETLQRYGAELALNYNLLQFLATFPRLREARAEERIALLRLREDESNTALRTSDAYLRLLAQWEAQRALEALRADYLEFFHRIEERFQLQIVPALEYTRARSQMISLERELLNLQGEAIAAELELRRLAGLKPEQSLQLVFDDRDVDLAAIKSAGLPGLLASAQEANPRLLAAETAIASARSRVDGARSAYYPTFSVSASGGVGRDEVLNQGGRSSATLQYNVSSSLSLSLFDGGVRRARLAQATARVETQIRDADRMEAEVKELIENGYWTFIQKEHDFAYVQQELQLAEEEFKQARERASEGVTVVTDVLSSFTKLVRLRQTRARARSDTLVKGIRLALAVGSYPFGQAASAHHTLNAPGFVSGPVQTPPVWQSRTVAPNAAGPVSRVAARAEPPVRQEIVLPAWQSQTVAPNAVRPVSRVAARAEPPARQEIVLPAWQSRAVAPAPNVARPVNLVVARPALPVRQETILPAWQPQAMAPVHQVAVQPEMPGQQETIFPPWLPRPTLSGTNVIKPAPPVRQATVLSARQPQATTPGTHAATPVNRVMQPKVATLGRHGYTPMSRLVARPAPPTRQVTVLPAWPHQATATAPNTAPSFNQAVAIQERPARGGSGVERWNGHTSSFTAPSAVHGFPESSR